MTVVHQDFKIGIALSGGGLRAAVFHFGVLARLAEDGLLENIQFMSTVSGGSLGMGLIYTKSGRRLPSSHLYLQSIISILRNTLTSVDLRWRFILRTLTSPRHIARRRANDFALILAEHWGVDANLQELPSIPRWLINSTCHQTGANWRFERKRMGDPKFGHVEYPIFPLGAAVAASSAVPGFVGPYVLEAEQMKWKRFVSRTSTTDIKPPYSKVHLFDGALYDNLGVEALIKRTEPDFNFLVVSNAGFKLDNEPYGFGIRCYDRIKQIVLSRSSSLYTRMFFANYLKGDNSRGRYLQFGNSAEYILSEANRSSALKRLNRVMSQNEHDVSASVGLMKMKLSRKEFYCLFLHGYEVANCTFHAYDPSRFDLKTGFPSF